MTDKNYTINKHGKKEIVWNSFWHFTLADVYMDATDNISCYDGCKEMARDLFDGDPEKAIKIIKKELKG
tara:strand:+ start:301 stop:507 length:207 start_codon:yes stop_codon:yes gene_type:complete